MVEAQKGRDWQGDVHHQHVGAIPWRIQENLFLPNNVVYEVKRKFRELKQMGSIWAYVKEFIPLTLQIPNLIEQDMLFHFMDGLQNWANTELEQWQVKTIDDAITQVESFTDFKYERHDKAKRRDAKSSHDKGGGDRGWGKEHQAHPKLHDLHKLDNKRFVHKNYTKKRA